MKTIIDKSDVHLEICVGLNELYKIKSHDYGDSFTHTRELIPNAILVRLHDKLNRLDTLLLKGNQKVKDESIEDTLRDLAGYAILELLEREFEKQYKEVDRLVIDFGSMDKAEDFKGSFNGEPIDSTYDKSKEVSAMTSEEVVEYYKQKEGK